MTDAGVCTNQNCPRGTSGELTERYPGPGAYCPDCGELLEPARTTRAAPAPQNIGPESLRTLIVACCAALAVAAIAETVVVAVPALAALGIRVCTTTMTDRIGDEIVRAYKARHSEWPYHFDLTRPGDAACDVRFYAAVTGPEDAAIARDGVVAVVNPQNGISHLSGSQLRDVLAGRLVDWSQLGGRPGAIAPIIPDDASDATAIVAERIMHGTPFGAHVTHALDATDLVRSVARPDGIRSIGIAPFSAAGPAKVLAFDHATPPRPASIGDGRYPLSVRIMADSDFRHPSNAAAHLIAFAHSTDARDVVARTAVIGLR